MLELLPQILMALSPLFLAALGWLAKRGSDWIVANTSNQYLQSTLLRLDDAVFAAVKELAQVSVDAAKAASESGKLPAEVATEAKRAAIAKAKEMLGPRGLAELAKVFGLQGDAVDRFVGTRVEAAVLDLKRAEGHRIQQLTPTP